MRAQVREAIGADYDGQTPVRHLLEIVTEDLGPPDVTSKVTRPLTGLKVACYYGCLLARPPEVMQFDDAEDPTLMDQFLETAGATVVDWPHKTECCGASFSITDGDLVVELTDKILAMAQAAGVDCIATACPLCQLNLDMRQKDVDSKLGHKYDLPVFYFTQLLGLAWAAPPTRWGWSSLIVDPKPLLSPKDYSRTRADERQRQEHRHGQRPRTRRRPPRVSPWAPSWSAAPASPASRRRSIWPRAASRSTWSIRRRPSAAGWRMLDKTFPTGDCSMCILSPKLVECARNKNIEIITLADVEGISGEPGNFKVKLRQNPRFVDTDKCNACGDCIEACPVDLPNEFDRKPGHPQGHLPGLSAGHTQRLWHHQGSGPRPCRSACPAGINVQGYVALIGAGKFTRPTTSSSEECPLPATCGRICAHPCETACTRGSVDEPIAIAALKWFAFDKAPRPEQPEKLPRALRREGGDHRWRSGRPELRP